MCTVCAAGCPYVSVFKTIREFATLAYPETPYHPNRAHEIACETDGRVQRNDTDIQYADVVVVDGEVTKGIDAPIVLAESVIVRL